MTIWRLTTLLSMLHLCTAESIIGINCGRLANNLPRPKDITRLVTTHNIHHIKIFDSDRATIRAFDHSNIALVISVPNENLTSLARSPKTARTWIHNHVTKRLPKAKITHLLVGNEILSGVPEMWPALVPAMWNLHSALVYYKLDHQIKISTPHSASVLAALFPPSAGVFRNDIRIPVMKKLLEFLRITESTFMMNIYPYFLVRDYPVNVSLAYALFLDNPGADDVKTGLHYGNLFDAMLDASIYAMKELGYDDVPVMVTETGWPSKGDASEVVATIANAKIYNNNLVKHVTSKEGSPARPGRSIPTFIFALFNENEKGGPASERNFGLFYPNKTHVYDLSFT